MIRPLRRAHLIIVFITGAVTLAVTIAALVRRP
jgi:hypothetical protein